MEASGNDVLLTHAIARIMLNNSIDQQSSDVMGKRRSKNVSIITNVGCK